MRQAQESAGDVSATSVILGAAARRRPRRMAAPHLGGTLALAPQSDGSDDFIGPACPSRRPDAKSIIASPRRAVSSAEEHFLDMEGVRGSIPLPPTRKSQTIKYIWR